MGIPQILVIMFMVFGLWASSEMHGKPSRTNFNHAVIGWAILMGLMIWGGFFEMKGD